MRIQSPTPPRHVALSLAGAALTLISLPGCVVERTPAASYGFNSGTRSSGAAPSTSQRAPAATNQASPAQLPDGPVARPVTPSKTQSSHVRAALMDLGQVSFDGLVLPLVSPDGRFIAVQDGLAPTWPTMLGAPGSEVPHGTFVKGFALPDPNSTNPAGQPPVAVATNWNDGPLSSVLLGRSADNTGFLIESPQPDGSRWLGHVAWISGRVTWLVQGAGVNAYATLGPAGELAYCRRSVDDHSITLIVRPDRNDPREYVASSPGGGYLWPLFSDEPGIVYAFSLVNGVVELHALKIPQKGDPPNLVVIARQPLLRNGDAMTIYQMVGVLQTPLPSTLTNRRDAAASNRQEGDHFDKLIFFHVGQGRMTVFDRRVGLMTPLFKGSFAATPVLGNEADANAPASGYLVTTQEGLEYIAWSLASDFDQRRGVPASSDEGVSVIKGGFVARLTSDPVWPVVLVGPVSGSKEPKIHLFRLKLDGAGL